jgi:hypothetical protein
MARLADVRRMVAWTLLGLFVGLPLLLRVTWAQAVGEVAAQDVLLQQQQETLDQDAFAQAQWLNTTSMLVDVSAGLVLATANVSALYSPAGAANLTAAVNAGECVVSPARNYVLNATLVYDFLCCVVRKLRAPALVQTVTIAYETYLGAPMDSDADNTAAVLQGLQTMQSLDQLGFAQRPCLSTQGTFAAQQSAVQATNAMAVASWLLEAEGSVYINAQAVAGCQQAPAAATGCLSNATLDISAPAAFPNTRYWRYDPTYAEVCSPAALAAFYAAQIRNWCLPNGGF